MNTSLSLLAFSSLTLLAAGCSKKDEPSEAHAAQAAAQPAPKPAAQPAPPPSQDGPASIKPVTQAIGGAPVKAVVKSAQVKGSGYEMVFELTNTGTKDIKQVFYTGCTYDSSGKQVGPKPANGFMLALKPKAKGETSIFLGYTSDKVAGAAMAVTELLFADGSKWEDHMVDCPSQAKL